METLRKIWLPVVLAIQTAGLAGLGWLVWDTRATTARMYDNQPETWGQEPDYVERIERKISDVGDNAARAADAAEGAKTASEKACKELGAFMC